MKYPHGYYIEDKANEVFSMFDGDVPRTGDEVVLSGCYKAGRYLVIRVIWFDMRHVGVEPLRCARVCLSPIL